MNRTRLRLVRFQVFLYLLAERNHAKKNAKSAGVFLVILYLGRLFCHALGIDMDFENNKK